MKVKPQCKFLYKLLTEKDVYDLLLDIYPYPTLIKLKDFIGVIHHHVTVVGKWMFKNNFRFSLPLTQQL